MEVDRVWIRIKSRDAAMRDLDYKRREKMVRGRKKKLVQASSRMDAALSRLGEASEGSAAVSGSTSDAGSSSTSGTRAYTTAVLAGV